MTIKKCMTSYPKSLTDLTFTSDKYTDNYIPDTITRLNIQCMTTRGTYGRMSCIDPQILPSGLVSLICDYFEFSEDCEKTWKPCEILKFVEIDEVSFYGDATFDHERMFKHCETASFGSFVKKRTLDGFVWSKW